MTQFDPDQVDEEEGSPKDFRRQLAQQAAENKRLSDELASRDRELAFTKVGLPDTPIASFFRDNYTGDTSEDAIRHRASELGILATTSPETRAEVEAIEQMSADASGGIAPLPQGQAEEMDKAMRAIRPGPRYAEEMELVLQRFGRPTRIDET